MKKNFLIWGGGLAGTFLAAQLIRAGQQVILIDYPYPQRASTVAAGLYNVITGRFGAKSWMADTLLSHLKAFFEIPIFTPLKFFLHETPIYRPFKETAEYNKWSARAKDPDYSHLVTFQEQPLVPHLLYNEHGGIMINGCGWLDTAGFLVALQQLLIQQYGMSYIPQKVSYEQLDWESKQIAVAGSSISFDELIFCEGYEGDRNPFFPEVKLIPNKGELLTIAIPQVHLPFVLSKKVYVIPLSSDLYVVGSTYQNTFSHLDPTPEGQEEITIYLKKALRTSFQVISHTAGVRPTTPNRRPILGSHATYPFLHMLNGLGTKGVLQAPYCASLLTDYLLGKTVDIPAEACIGRFRS